MKRDLKSMVVVITGASSGIGRALAIELAQRGARLVLSARRLDRLEELNQELGGQHLSVRADVSVPEDCARLIQQAHSHFSRIDTLVCNAGYGLARDVAETTPEELLAIVKTNVMGTSECVRAAVPLMRQQTPRDGLRGQVVMVSSAAARRGLPHFGAYSATKAAQLSLAESLRVELRGKGIMVTTVHPVGTETEFGSSAEKISNVRITNRAAIEVRQTAEQVACAIVRGIQKPMREVWPFRTMHLLTSIGTLFPALGDLVMKRHRRALEPSDNAI